MELCRHQLLGGVLEQLLTSFIICFFPAKFVALFINTIYHQAIKHILKAF